MGSENHTKDEFQVNITSKSILQATHSNPNSLNLALSNLDLLSGRFPVTYFYFYRNLATKNFTSIVEILKSSLTITLNHFYPFAGRIVQNPRTNEPEIVCDNTGALFLEAYADIALNETEFHNLDQFMKGKLVNIDPNFALQVQVTQFSCGGTSITFTFDHALGDASAFGKFLVSWSEIAQHKQISCMPDHRRNLRARNPPTYHPSLNQAFVKCTIEEILNIPTKEDILLKRLYHIDAASIDHLQKLASSKGQRTKIEALSAHIWKVMVGAIGEAHKECRMGWLVDGRTRMCRDSSLNSMSNYIGNVLSLAVGEASVKDLNDGSLSEIANRVHNAISRVTNRDHFLDLIDWIECHRPGLMLSRVVLGQGGPTLVLSSGRRFPVAELDFGFGSPILGTVCSTIERIGVAYMNQRPSARNDGSWTLSAIIWPKLAAVLESDPIFQPMSTKHLQL
ncbi:anthranilate N-benzoyltransferase protein 1 [Punica granatum]|uniref:Anthranilate N-benzoyltransferase protein 1 n=1 Tax=Punica granatum TaxID=22663 RepID=A0A6P8DEL5_PUNGR|nr:anthranilate N-benzoyltransferase protein 1 [Punica granatum]